MEAICQCSPRERVYRGVVGFYFVLLIINMEDDDDDGEEEVRIAFECHL